MGWFRRSRKKQTQPVEQVDLWTICPSCKAHIYKEEWAKALMVCAKCGFHDKLTCHERVACTVDEKSFRELDRDIKPRDHLKFSDAKSRYADKAKETTEELGINEAILTGRATLNGIPIVLGVMDFRFIGGSLSSGVGDKIYLASDYALRHKRPLILFSASGGARMQEGIVSLMQMAKTCAGISRLNKAGIPYISVLTNPTFGGVSASYAMVGDLNIAEPGALIGFAGRRVIEQTIKQTLPPDFQTAEYLLAHGFVDRIVPRSEMKDLLAKVLCYGRRGKPPCKP
ncbi:MAG: acetyl-CoA carboxylase carboxyltransferase subunit beta [Lentisphaerae bacterium]|nr:acetyl-CoA carboxylase carboxyltransferase subunit beta [Lentisphaerota bacterium]